MSSISNSRLWFAGMRMAYCTPRSLRSFINFRLGKGRIAPESDLLAFGLLSFDLRQQQLVPVVSAVHLAARDRRRHLES